MGTTNRPSDGMVLDALLFATEQHDGQVRRGTDLPYITHLIAVSYIVAQFKRSRHLPELVTAAILHNISDRPTPKMVTDTLEILAHIQKVRRLTATQQHLVERITVACGNARGGG